MPHRMNFTSEKIILLSQKYYCEIGIIVAMNEMFKLAVFSIHH